MKKIKEMRNNFDWYVKKPIPVKATQIDIPFKVETMEGILEGKAGDYLVEGIEGELYPCDKEVFENTYVKITDKNNGKN